jgi:hypothetical protein
MNCTYSNVSIKFQCYCTKYIYSNTNPNLIPFSTLILGIEVSQSFYFVSALIPGFRVNYGQLKQLETWQTYKRKRQGMKHQKNGWLDGFWNRETKTWTNTYVCHIKFYNFYDYDDDDDNNNSILYYLCAQWTVVRPITDTAQCRYK